MNQVQAIVAMTPSRIIGVEGGGMPWRQRNDLQRFKGLTQGHIVVMGRRTADTLPSALSGRANFVFTRGAIYPRKDFIIVRSWEDVLANAALFPDSKIFIIGGGQIYSKFLKYAQVLHRTIVYNDFPYRNAVKFPKLKPANWSCTYSVLNYKSPFNQYDYKYETLVTSK